MGSSDAIDESRVDSSGSEAWSLDFAHGALATLMQHEKKKIEEIEEIKM